MPKTVIMHTSAFDIESILRKDSDTGREEGKENKTEPEAVNVVRNSGVVSRRPLLLPRVEPIQWSSFVYNLPYSCNHCDDGHVSPWLQYGQHAYMTQSGGWLKIYEATFVVRLLLLDRNYI